MSDAAADSPQRRQALDIERSFCVQAPAGSGKTELLTQRVLRLLAHCERPEEILAITFTRKAAAEMRLRLLQNLQEAATKSDAQIAAEAPHRRLTLELAAAVLARNESQDWQLLENTARLRITTIDSFNSHLCGQLPLTSHFGGAAEIGDDLDALYREAVAATLDTLERNDPLADDLAELLTHLNNNLPSVEKLLCRLLASREQWLTTLMEIGRHPRQARRRLEDNLRALVEESLEHLRDLLAPWDSQLMQVLNFAADNLALAGDTRLAALDFGARLPGADAAELERWQALAAFLLTSADAYRRTVNVKNGFPAPASSSNAEEKALFTQRKQQCQTLLAELAEHGEVLAQLILLRNLPAPHYAEAQWRVLQSLTRVLPLLVAQLDLVFRRRGQVDYVQVANAALDALGEEEAPTDLALRLDYRIRHILVDEFQDTSSAQVRLLEKLCCGWQPGDGRTLFIVGDGMQSCYGFRNADVGLFLQARDHGIGPVALESLQLSVNFRSDSAVVDWVNHLFGAAFPAEDDIGRGAVRYSPSTGRGAAFADAGVETRLFAYDGKLPGIRASVARREAGEVVSLVRGIRRDTPNAGIAILVRNRSHLERIIPALREADLAWHASDIDPLSSYPAIGDLISLLRALLNLADATAWLALLRAPWAGLALADIHRLALHARLAQQPLWHGLRDWAQVDGLSPDAGARLRRLVPALNLARRQRQRLPLRQWLEGAWINLGGPACLRGDSELANVESFFQLLQRHARQGEIEDIHDFEQKVAGVYGSSSPAGGARLQIMTIHKAKGLEFDYVIIPGLGRSPRGDDKPLLRWKEHLGADGEKRLLMGLPGSRGGEPDSVYDYLGYESALRSRMENTRLLYIGVTRASRKAWLLGSVRCKNDQGELAEPDRNSLLATLWQPLRERRHLIACDISEVAAEADPESGEDAPVARLLTRRLPAGWTHPLPPPPGAGEEPDEADGAEAPAPSHHHLPERARGEIIHYCLKLAGEGRLDLYDDAALTALEPGWRTRLRPVCEDIGAAVAAIHANLRRCREYPDLAWLLDRAHTDSASELSLSDYRGGYRREFVVDRAFVDAGGLRWIIDYKSAAPGRGQRLEDFLRQQAERYRPQLADYAGLFRAMEDRPIRTALFFTALPHLLELDTEEEPPGAPVQQQLL